jgi:hypothetical protein
VHFSASLYCAKFKKQLANLKKFATLIKWAGIVPSMQKELARPSQWLLYDRWKPNVDSGESPGLSPRLRLLRTSSQALGPEKLQKKLGLAQPN